MPNASGLVYFITSARAFLRELSSLMPHRVFEVLPPIPSGRPMAGSDPAENLNFEMSGMFPLAITAEDKQIVPSATASQVLFLKRLFTHTGYDRIPGGIPASQTAPGEDSTAQLPLHLVDLYEYRTTASPASSPRQVLRHLMDRRQLKQADLAPVFGTVSEALNGKRQINAKQARKLADYFHISAGVFV